MSKTIKWTLLAMASAALVACGGGGGGGSASNPLVTVAGTAAKGLMANADVALYAVGPDGKPLASPLASTTTGSDGKYTLVFTGIKGQPYVIVVSAKADGSTTHLDEVTGQPQPLPAGFSMRALLLPEIDGPVSTSVSITPFSEMAVAAATRASGGITAANARQASSTIAQLLGFDPTAVSVVSATDARATVEQQKLAVMLTAVSQMASNRDLGCVTAQNPTQCVVEKLSTSTSITSLALGGGVSSALQAATETVLNNTQLVGAIPASTLVNIVTNLSCSGAACEAALVGSAPAVSDPVALAITSAKLLFTQIKTDLTTMFSRDGVSASSAGALNQEAFKFKTAMTGVQVPVDMAVKDVGAMLLGIQLYRDYKSGLTDSPSRERYRMRVADGLYAVTDAGCELYQDASITVLASAPDNANYIRCSARHHGTYDFTQNAYVETLWQHGLTMTPSADGSFAYVARAKKSTTTCGWAADYECVGPVDASVQLDASSRPMDFTGRMTPTLTGGVMTGFALQGDLPAAFESGGTVLANHKSAVDLTGTRTLSDGEITALSLAGGMTGYQDASTRESQLTIKSGRVARDSGAVFNMLWNTGSAEFEGDFSLGDMSSDQSGSSMVPTTLALNGMLRNIENGVSTEFLSGRLSANVTGYADFNVTRPASVRNQFTGHLSFVGAVTAPNRPQLELTLGASVVNDGNQTLSPVTLQYRTLVDGAPRSVVTLTGTPGAAGTAGRFKLEEATSGLSMSWGEGASQIDLVFGNPATRIGTLGSGVLNFTDGSFISLDLGW